MQMVHVVTIWTLMPLQQVRWRAGLLGVQETALLAMAAALLICGPSFPTWLDDGIFWMLPIIIATMLIGDALAGPHQTPLPVSRCDLVPRCPLRTGLLQTFGLGSSCA
jgi:hypothetical protein